MTPSADAIRAVGCKAHAALERSGGIVVTLPGFANARYAAAGGEIIWIGAGAVAMHPRAVVLRDARLPVAGARLQPGAAAPWRPAPIALDAAGVVAMGNGCARLHRDLHRVGAPKGLAALLCGRSPPFPLDRIAPRVHLLAQAFHHADVGAVYAAAMPLLGLGPGLTPSGDDLVGAALFARRAVANSPSEATAWNDLALRLSDAARTRSHAIGAALFDDLAHGESFAPLHDLVAVLSAAAQREARLEAARAVVAIGHSSGWDMLAGFIIGTTGMLAPYRYDRKSTC